MNFNTKFEAKYIYIYNIVNVEEILVVLTYKGKLLISQTLGGIDRLSNLMK